METTFSHRKLKNVGGIGDLEKSLASVTTVRVPMKFEEFLHFGWPVDPSPADFDSPCGQNPF